MAQEAKDWSVDTSLLYYGEDNGRVEDVSLLASIRRAFDEDRSLNFSLTVDSLTGATPNGAVPANAPQTFTGPSGGGSYTIAPGEQPLDTTFLDTRIALAASWQQSLGNAMRWNVGFSSSDEYDYLHLGVDARLERDFNMRNTTAFIGVAYGQDEIKPVGGTPIGLTPMAGEVEDEDGDDSGEDRGRNADDSKDVADLLIGVTQVLSRRSLLEVSYSYGQSDGYLTDPYKILSVVDPVTGVPVAGPEDEVPFLYLYEQRPDSRTKQSLLRRVALRARPRLLRAQLPLHGRRLGRAVADGGGALPLEHQRPLLPRAAPALVHAERRGFLSHRAVRGRCAARVRDGRLPARRPRRLHDRRQVRPAAPTTASFRSGSSITSSRRTNRRARRSATSRDSTSRPT